jgi:hypothetical protein
MAVASILSFLGHAIRSDDERVLLLSLVILRIRTGMTLTLVSPKAPHWKLIGFVDLTIFITPTPDIRTYSTTLRGLRSAKKISSYSDEIGLDQ